MRSGRAFARIDDGRVVFKAEIGSVQRGGLPGAGRLGARRTCAGAASPRRAWPPWPRCARREIAPVVSLYVNDYNAAARATYRRVGFTDVGAFMSVLF